MTANYFFRFFHRGRERSTYKMVDYHILILTYSIKSNHTLVSITGCSKNYILKFFFNFRFHDISQISARKYESIIWSNPTNSSTFKKLFFGIKFLKAFKWMYSLPSCNWLIDWLIVWLIDWLIDWLIGWLIDCWLLNVQQQIFHSYSGWEQIQQHLKLDRNDGGMGQQRQWL